MDFHVGPEFFKNMENPDILDADVDVHLALVNKNGVYDCTFTCKGHLSIPCDRCLEPLDHEVDTVYHVIVKYGEEYDDASDEVLVIPETSRSLNVAYMLNDTIVLTIPIRHVHPMGKCNRAMAAVLNRHSTQTSDEEAAEAMEEIDSEPDDE